MRIAYITHYAELYGANRSLIDLVLEARARAEVDPLVIAPREGPLTDLLRGEGVECAVIPFEPWMSERHYSGRYYHKAVQWWGYARAAFARTRANAALVPDISSVLKNARIELVHANSTAVSIALAGAKACGLPLVQHVREMPEKHYRLHLDMGRSGYAALLNNAAHVIAISNAAANDARRYAPRAEIKVIYNGVLREARYADLIAGSEVRWKSTTPFHFVMVGLLHPGKRYDEAVDALRIVRRKGLDARLTIAGGGRDRDLLIHIYRAGMAPFVDMWGFVEDPFPLFAQSHALLQCSRDEAMGRVTVEAMASALPVIGQASGATPEIVEDGVTGLLYHDGAEQLAERMVALISDPARAREMGERGAASARARFSVEHCASDILAVYRSVLSAAK